MRTYLHRLLGCLPALLVSLAVLSVTEPAGAVETVTYYHNDIAGTPILATDAAGAVLWKENYRPYGDKLNNPPAGADNKLGFTGKPYDPNTGLSYMGARYYDPVIGRFTGIDPLDYDEKNLHSFNRYTYANNNPYKYVDPDGRAATLYLIGMGALTVGYIITVTQPKADQERLARQLSSALGNIFSQSGANDEGGAKGEAGKGTENQTGKESPVPGATLGDKTKGRTTQWEKGGGFDEANRDFDTKKPNDVVPLPDGGRRGTLPDGRQINVRPDSTDGRPTLEIQNGKNRDKVRYNQ